MRKPFKDLPPLCSNTFHMYLDTEKINRNICRSMKKIVILDKAKKSFYGDWRVISMLISAKRGVWKFRIVTQEPYPGWITKFHNIIFTTRPNQPAPLQPQHKAKPYFSVYVPKEAALPSDKTVKKFIIS